MTILEDAWDEVCKHMAANKKLISVDATARAILGVFFNSHVVYFFNREVVEEIVEAKLAETQDISEREELHFLAESVKNHAFYAPFRIEQASYLIAIAMDVPEEFWLCEFVHEYCHHQFKKGIRTSGNEEEISLQLGDTYAEQKGITKEYALFQLQFHDERYH